MELIYILVLIVIFLVLLGLVCLFYMAPGMVFYYRYPDSNVVQAGSFETDDVVVSTRLTDLYTDPKLQNKVGVLQTQSRYTHYPNGLMTLNKEMNIIYKNVVYYLTNFETYLKDTFGKPDNYYFDGSFVLSGMNPFYIGRTVKITKIADDVYQILI